MKVFPLLMILYALCGMAFLITAGHADESVPSAATGQIRINSAALTFVAPPIPTGKGDERC